MTYRKQAQENPFDNFFNFDLDALFKQTFGNITTVNASTQIETSEDGTVITVQVPGQNRESLNLTIQGNEISLTSIEEKASKKARPIKVSWKDVENRFDLTKISAECVDGVLTIELPLKEEKKPYTVTIK